MAAKLPLQGGFHNDQLRIWQGRKNQINADCLMYPMFISAKDEDLMEEIESFPGQYKIGKNKIVEYLKPMVANGLKSVLLFGTDIDKEEWYKTSHMADPCCNPVLEAIEIIKSSFPHVTVACDVCICAISRHGLCYDLLDVASDYENKILPYMWWKDDEDDEKTALARRIQHFPADVKKTCENLARIAYAYAKHGADIVAPSDMNDGRVAEIDEMLRNYHFRSKCAIMSYSAKFASCMYGPFRDTCNSTPTTNSRNGSQLPPCAAGLANRATTRDINENADIVMVKPSMMYLDIVRDIKVQHPHHPIAAYQVSGEYAMLYHASKSGVFDLKTVVYENFQCMQRAGVDIIINYFTPKVLEWIKEDREKEAASLATSIERAERKEEERRE